MSAARNAAGPAARGRRPRGRVKKNPRLSNRGLDTGEETYMRPQAWQADPPEKFAAMSEAGTVSRPSKGLESQLLPSTPQGL